MPLSGEINTSTFTMDLLLSTSVKFIRNLIGSYSRHKARSIRNRGVIIFRWLTRVEARAGGMTAYTLLWKWQRAFAARYTSEDAYMRYNNSCRIGWTLEEVIELYFLVEWLRGATAQHQRTPRKAWFYMAMFVPLLTPICSTYWIANPDFADDDHVQKGASIPTFTVLRPKVVVIEVFITSLVSGQNDDNIIATQAGDLAVVNDRDSQLARESLCRLFVGPYDYRVFAAGARCLSDKYD
ncbi:hypothetical protein M405DRAFT_884177 [Rhizopogon salebrosus TDB-379]|nr:hypothetical protein M405DRAFT_884177 [Rhizopogon salebrosus TDB-379]